MGKQWFSIEYNFFVLKLTSALPYRILFGETLVVFQTRNQIWHNTTLLQQSIFRIHRRVPQVFSWTAQNVNGGYIIDMKPYISNLNDNLHSWEHIVKRDFGGIFL